MVPQPPGEDTPEVEKVPVPIRKPPLNLSIGFLLSLLVFGFLIYRLISPAGVSCKRFHTASSNMTLPRANP